MSHLHCKQLYPWKNQEDIERLPKTLTRGTEKISLL